MLTLPSSVQIYVATEPVDCRRSFDGLSNAVRERLGHDPLSGHLYCFFNRRGNQARIVFWDRTGWCIIAKRLARGRFRLARAAHEGESYVKVDAAELSLLLEGIELDGAKRRKRYRREASATPTELVGR